MKKITLLCTLLTFVSSVYAQNWMPVGARSNALGNASVTLDDAWAFHHNPGALGELRQVAVGVSYENRFLLKELQTQSFVYAQPLKYGIISVGGQFYGFSQYHTQRIGAGYSLKLSKFLFAGVQLNYLGMQLNSNYGNRHGVGASAGLQALIRENWRFGFSVNNITRARLNDYQDERFESLFRLGMSYHLSNKVLFLLEGSKTISDKVRGKFGVEYEAIENFRIRTGIKTAPIEFSFGFGYLWKIISIDAAVSYHQLLGWSPSFSLTYISNKIKK